MTGDEVFLSWNTITSVLSYLILAITIIVMAVPEGLPMAVVIALAYSVESMRQHNNLVRHMSACETMSSVSEICSDKTGTLTQNRMKVQDVFISTGSLISVKDGLKDDLKNNETFRNMCAAVCVNSSACPNFNKPFSEQNGNRTELAILEVAKDAGIDYSQVRDDDSILLLKPFSSDTKKMLTLYKTQLDNRVYLYVKGAPEVLINTCSTYVDGMTHVTKNVDGHYKKFLADNILKVLGGKKARAIGVAYKEFDLADIKGDYGSESWLDENDSGLTFLGVFGIEDPIRPEVPEAIKLCHKAKINVRMVTGDNTAIATAIAKECFILDKNYNAEEEPFAVMEGKTFRECVGGLVEENVEEPDSDDDNADDKKEKKLVKKTKYRVGNLNNFMKVQQKLQVLARSLPEDKLLLVTGLQEMNKVVAVTGDGTNDAPALKKSNVGFAMGKMGTDVCKAASKIVLLDDSFASIVISVRYGRNVFDAIRKFVQFQLTCNLVAMACAIVGGLALEESPINSIQVFFIILKEKDALVELYYG